MTTLTIAYSYSAASGKARLTDLQKVYDSLPAARKAMDRNPAARQLIGDAGAFQAQLRNSVLKKSSLAADYAAAAMTQPVNNDVMVAQLAIASIAPRVNAKLTTMLQSHAAYEQSIQPGLGRRLLNLVSFNR
jgi:hypothetical protein